MAPSTETDRQIELSTQTIPHLRLLFSGGQVAPLDQAEFPLQSVVVSGKGVLLGREVSPKEGIPLSGDKRASALHARVRVTPDGSAVLVQDLGSKNGTFVDGELCKEARLSLAQPAVLRVGNSLFVLRGIGPTPWESSRLAPKVRDQSLLVGTSPEIELLRYLLLCAAEQEHAVLLTGESGTGKELATKLLHASSRRSDRPLVAVNCASIPDSLAESQLFGYVAGAFTGAKAPQHGWFRQAHGGVLFLDEIGELPLSLQPKFLRALEEGLIWPVGAREPTPIDVRVVAATNRDLDDAVQRGGFRADLLGRLAGLRVTLPRLASRPEDILPLFLRKLGRPLRLSARLAEALLLYPWPLNVRELNGLAQHATTFAAQAEELDLPLFIDRLRPPRPLASASGHESVARTPPSAAVPGLPAMVATPSNSTPPSGSDGELQPVVGGISSEPLRSPAAYATPSGPAPSALSPSPRESYSPAFLERLLREGQGNISWLARRLGISRRTLNRWLRSAGLRSQDFRESAPGEARMLSQTVSADEPEDAEIPKGRKSDD